MVYGEVDVIMKMVSCKVTTVVNKASMPDWGVDLPGDLLNF